MGSTAAEEAKKYLQENEIPKLFEGLMTGLIYNKPAKPIDFMASALATLKSQPNLKLSWDMFVDNAPNGGTAHIAAETASETRGSETRASEPRASPTTTPSTPSSHLTERKNSSGRPASVMAKAARAQIPQVPIVLFMGGPGGGKTRLAARVGESLQEETGLVHICMPDLIKSGISKYKDRYRDWKEAHRKYDEGELIPNHLALALMKAEMGKHPDARAFLLEGYPRELQQVNDFEIEVKPIDMAMILDFDESTLRSQMKAKGLRDKVIDQRIMEFKSKTLPAAKYFDDKMLLHLVPGEQPEDAVFAQVRGLVEGAVTSKQDATSEPPPSAVGDASSEAPSSRMEEEPQQDVVAAAAAAVSELADDVPTGLPNDAPVILVIGAPGCQKGEYCKRIAKKYDGFVHVSLGDLLRQQAKENPEDEECAKYANAMAQGETVPESVCRKLVYNAIHASENSWGYVIDGYPRTVDQAKDFEAVVDRIDLALLIDCTEQFCLNTLKQRSEAADEADRRADDTPAAVKLRLGLFKQNTLPMLKYFDEKGKLKVIDGDKGIDEIFQDVTNLIDASLFIPQDNGSGKSLESSKNSNEHPN